MIYRFFYCLIVLLLACCIATSLSANLTTSSHNETDNRQSGRLSLSVLHLESKQELHCGQSMKSYDSRITGGKAATITEFPWIVSVQRERDYWFGFKAYYHLCGGSLITPSWIVSAAHCFYNRDETYRVVAGTDNMDFLYHSQVRKISKLIIHPDFDSSNFNNDLALIKVTKPFVFGAQYSRVSAICLERDVPIYTYDIATICGFGARAFHEKSQRHLFKTEIAIIDQSVCNSSFGGDITNNMICAGGMIDRKRDACSGDSGGPLQMDVENHMSLIGVVSFGNDCASRGYPGIYTRLNNYYDWILEHLDEKLIKV